MRSNSRVSLFAGVLTLGALPLPSFAQAPAAVPFIPPAPAVAPRPAAATPTQAPAPTQASATSTTKAPAPATRASYWGPAPPVAPKKKPNAVRRVFNRIGSFLGADEEMGTTPVYRDPSTGRTNTGASKPYLKPLEK